jgi:hypothetical protein
MEISSSSGNMVNIYQDFHCHNEKTSTRISRNNCVLGYVYFLEGTVQCGIM